jgi:hypothetical protein
MSDLDPCGVPQAVTPKLDQSLVVPVDELIRMTAELEAIRDLLRSIRNVLVRITPAMEVISQLAQEDRAAR